MAFDRRNVEQRGTQSARTNSAVDSGSTKILAVTFLWILTTSGVSNRWTLTIPLIPFSLIHLIHRLTRSTRSANNANRMVSAPPEPSTQRSGSCLHWTLIALGTLCIMAGALLSILFPALELPTVDGPYRVGVIDFYIPVNAIDAIPNGQRNDTKTEDTCLLDEKELTLSGATCSLTARSTNNVYLPARLLYPTLHVGSRWDFGVPYLNPATAVEFCQHSMLYAAPPPLKRFGWILHTWRLTRLALLRSAPMLNTTDVHGRSQQLPLVVYSHGFGGTLDLYSYQTMMLASHGSIVLTLTHTDGTAPVVPQPDENNALPHNGKILTLHQQGKTVDYVRSRRLQTGHRARELIHATEFLHQAMVDSDNKGSKDHTVHTHSSLQPSHENLRSLLFGVRVNHTTFAGHSHGGASVLTAAHWRGDLVDAIVAHEPAIDWAPDSCRRALFQSETINGLPVEYDGGTGNFENATSTQDNSRNGSLRDLDILIMNSNQWVDKGWGSIALLDMMFRNGNIGRPNGPSRHVVVTNSTHNEFSDTSMLTPLWLARPTALAGPRNPIDTAAEIAAHTRSFLEEARR